MRVTTRKAKEEKKGTRKAGRKGRRVKTSRWPSRNDTWTEVYAGNVYDTFMHARTLVHCFVLHIGKGKGSFPLSLVVDWKASGQ